MLRVLIVDDDPVTLKLLCKAVENAEGIEVNSANSAESGLEVLQTRPVNVLVTDLVMPGRNGIDFFNEARRQRPLLRGILCSAHLDYQTMLQVVESGFDDCFIKPVTDFHGLVNAVRRSGERLENWKHRIAELRGFAGHANN